MGGWGKFSVPVWTAGQEVMLGGPGGDELDQRLKQSSPGAGEEESVKEIQGV